ncbi:MAG TPA: hypothetical protein VN664_09070, partial [Burkholderiales bacterium]|nr:hypothetical protein [Burkholderiales bacterium]
MGRFKFVVSMYCFAVVVSLLSAINTYECVSLWVAGVDAEMSSNDPDVARVAKFARGNSMEADVLYTSARGQL